MLDGRFVDLQKRLGFKIEHPHRVRIAVKKKTILFFTVAQFLFRTPAVRHVAAIGHHAGNFRILQPILPDQFQMPPVAIFMLVAKLDFYRPLRLVEGKLETPLSPAGHPRDA